MHEPMTLLRGIALRFLRDRRRAGGAGEVPARVRNCAVPRPTLPARPSRVQGPGQGAHWREWRPETRRLDRDQRRRSLMQAPEAEIRGFTIDVSDEQLD